VPASGVIDAADGRAQASALYLCANYLGSSLVGWWAWRL